MSSEHDLFYCCSCGQEFDIEDIVTNCTTCYNPMPEWIKCSEKLPDLQCRVLVNHCSLGVISGYRHYEDSFTCDSILNFPIEQITHWMQLPMPPEIPNE